MTATDPLTRTGLPGLDRGVLTTVARAGHIAVVAFVTSSVVAMAADHGVLLPVAIPLGLALVGALAWLPPRAQLVGWSAVSIWLLSTVYLASGPWEYAALVVVVLLAVAGVVGSPWFLVALWAFHPLWDLVPRDLPASLQDLPMACLRYDLIVAVYLAWRVHRGFFAVLGSTPGGTGRLAPGWRGGLIRVGLALAAVAVTAGQALVTIGVSSAGTATLVALPLAIAVILLLRRLPRNAELPAWGLLVGWIGMTYAHSGAALEIGVFAVVVLLVMLGVLGWSGYLALACAAHAL